ncbi:hypothetical protein TBLA_0F03200 [Henningerozyma blattae CBS 6284]|uniref:PH domain-containing protein n=1 Tax=Henningerozyma blattae (strain ATCC 34711 / CBS 6284 / DSM 70876 / NBRC 10599 / NRRL Y-10934 / UCD 77-7) TaxID=1071380 RepID=I2H656_HENB6|nr:hypothetical protein TBLA_0F03200 [Tetrapisispora blattae CBS 6284]CCH61858.1 hypothetical protein TBLA_0F03200 [Tetrapisispora blattae CBS 6284]
MSYQDQLGSHEVIYSSYLKKRPTTLNTLKTAGYNSSTTSNANVTANANATVNSNINADPGLNLNASTPSANSTVHRRFSTPGIIRPDAQQLLLLKPNGIINHSHTHPHLWWLKHGPTTYWCVLRRNQFSYYKTEDEREAVGVIPRSEFLSFRINHELSVIIIYAKENTFWFECKDEKILKGWEISLDEFWKIPKYKKEVSNNPEIIFDEKALFLKEKRKQERQEKKKKVKDKNKELIPNGSPKKLKDKSLDPNKEELKNQDESKLKKILSPKKIEDKPKEKLIDKLTEKPLDKSIEKSNEKSPLLRESPKKEEHTYNSEEDKIMHYNSINDPDKEYYTSNRTDPHTLNDHHLTSTSSNVLSSVSTANNINDYKDVLSYSTIGSRMPRSKSEEQFYETYDPRNPETEIYQSLIYILMKGRFNRTKWKKVKAVLTNHSLKLYSLRNDKLRKELDLDKVVDCVEIERGILDNLFAVITLDERLEFKTLNEDDTVEWIINFKSGMILRQKIKSIPRSGVSNNNSTTGSNNFSVSI